MSERHSVDEYLETIYFLAFPIGEYTPKGPGSPPLASRVAEMLGASRASAGELLHWFYDQGLVPGTSIRVRTADAAADQFTVTTDAGERAISEKAAAGLFVRPA